MRTFREYCQKGKSGFSILGVAMLFVAILSGIGNPVSWPKAFVDNNIYIADAGIISLLVGLVCAMFAPGETKTSPKNGNARLRRFCIKGQYWLLALGLSLLGLGGVMSTQEHAVSAWVSAVGWYVLGIGAICLALSVGCMMYVSGTDTGGPED